MEQQVELEQEIVIEFSQCPLCQSYKIDEQQRVYNCGRCGMVWKPFHKHQE
jgi:hypothetical protein